MLLRCLLRRKKQARHAWVRGCMAAYVRSGGEGQAAAANGGMVPYYVFRITYSVSRITGQVSAFPDHLSVSIR